MSRHLGADAGGRSAARAASVSHSSRCDRRSKQSCRIPDILFFGKSVSGGTPSALARQTNSKSDTQRTWASILARVSRLRTHPHRAQRAAKTGWLQFAASRSRRISGPVILRGFFISRSEIGTSSLDTSHGESRIVRNSERTHFSMKIWTSAADGRKRTARLLADVCLTMGHGARRRGPPGNPKCSSGCADAGDQPPATSGNKRNALLAPWKLLGFPSAGSFNHLAQVPEPVPPRRWSPRINSSPGAAGRRSGRSAAS